MSADVSPHPFGPIPERPAYCAECFGHEPDPIHHADDLPAGAIIDDDLEALAAELVAEYAAAVDRIQGARQIDELADRVTMADPIPITRP